MNGCAHRASDGTNGQGKPPAVGGVRARAKDYENKSCQRFLRNSRRPKWLRKNKPRAGEAQQRAKTQNPKCLRNFMKFERTWFKRGNF